MVAIFGAIGAWQEAEVDALAERLPHHGERVRV